MRSAFTPGQIWNYLTAVARAVNTTFWNGTAPNNLIAGRVDANAQVVGATARGTVKSIQRGVITLNGVTSNTASLSPTVDPANSELRLTGTESNVIVAANTAGFNLDGRVTLTSSSVVTATRCAGSASDASVTLVGWEVTERYS